MKEQIYLKEQFFRFLMDIVPFEALDDLFNDEHDFEVLIVVLGEDAALDFMALNFQQSKNKYEARRILRNTLDMAEYEKWRLIKMCQIIINKAPSYAMQIANLYDLYCKGYDFLSSVALEEALSLVTSDYQKFFSELSEIEQCQFADEYYPSIVRKVRRIKFALSLNRIIPTGKTNDLGHYQYLDLRTEKERI